MGFTITAEVDRGGVPGTAGAVGEIWRADLRADQQSRDIALIEYLQPYIFLRQLLDTEGSSERKASFSHHISTRIRFLTGSDNVPHCVTSVQ